MTSAHNILEKLEERKENGRSPLLFGSGAPDDTADVGWVYIRTDSGTTGDTVLYTWDDTGSTWDAMTA